MKWITLEAVISTMEYFISNQLSNLARIKPHQLTFVKETRKRIIAIK